MTSNDSGLTDPRTHSYHCPACQELHTITDAFLSTIPPSGVSQSCVNCRKQHLLNKDDHGCLRAHRLESSRKSAGPVSLPSRETVESAPEPSDAASSSSSGTHTRDSNASHNDLLKAIHNLVRFYQTDRTTAHASFAAATDAYEEHRLLFQRHFVEPMEKLRQRYPPEDVVKVWDNTLEKLKKTQEITVGEHLEAAIKDLAAEVVSLRKSSRDRVVEITSLFAGLLKQTKDTIHCLSKMMDDSMRELASFRELLDEYNTAKEDNRQRQAKRRSKDLLSDEGMRVFLDVYFKGRVGGASDAPSSPQPQQPDRGSVL